MNPYFENNLKALTHVRIEKRLTKKLSDLLLRKYTNYNDYVFAYTIIDLNNQHLKSDLKIITDLNLKPKDEKNTKTELRIIMNYNLGLAEKLREKWINQFKAIEREKVIFT